MILTAALTEIRRRIPALLNAVSPHRVEGVERKIGFADEHLFVMELPKWVLMAVVEAGEGERKRKHEQRLTNLGRPAITS